MIHLAEVIEDELRERGWSRDLLAWKMHPDATGEQWQINRLALDLFLEVQCPRVLLGPMAGQFARAFDVDAAFFENMHASWRSQAPACQMACCKTLAPEAA